MRTDWFSEKRLWEIAESEIQQGNTGKVVEICIQEIFDSTASDSGGNNEVHAFFTTWKSRLSPLFGHHKTHVVLEKPTTISALLQYENGLIVRLFADNASMGSTSSLDFEVIGKKNTLICRSNNGTIASIHTSPFASHNEGRIIRTDYNIADLETYTSGGKIIRLGVIGLDHPHAVGNHFPALRHIRHALKVVAIADPERNACEEWLEHFDAKYYAKRDDLLAAHDIDAVLITSQNWQHAADTIAAAHAKKDIFCDKPIATTLNDTLAIVEACQKNEVRFITTYPLRFHPAIQEVKQKIDSGEFGEIQAIMATNHGCMYDPGVPEWVKNPQKNGGGCIIDHTVHVADVMRYFTGEEFESIRTFAHSAGIKEIQAEDIAVSHGKMTGNIDYQLDCSWSRKASDPPWGDVTMRIVGSKGSASLDLYNNQKIDVYTENGLECRYTNPLCHQHGMIFLDYHAEKQTKKKNINASELDGLRTMELVFASYESVKKNKTVTVKRNLA